MYLKITNNDSRFYSPTKMSSNSIPQQGKEKLKELEKQSHRLEILKKEDSLLAADIVDHFWQKMELLKQRNQLPNLEPVAQCISD